MSIRTKDINKGYLEAMAEIAKVKRGPHVKVGFQGTSGDRPHSSGSKASVTDIATFNEFGTISKKGNPHIPARPFVRTTIDDNFRKLVKLNRRLFYRMSKGDMTTVRALKILGLEIQSLMQKKIVDIKEPPNAPSTIKRKGSSSPLQNTGRLKQSITFVVANAGIGASTEGTNKASGRQSRPSRRKLRKNRRIKKSAKHIQKRAGVNYRKGKRKALSKARHISKRAGVKYRKVKRAAKRRIKRRGKK